MDIRDRFFGRIATTTDNPEEIRLEPSALIEYLLLFDKVIIESIRLKDIRALVKFFGYDDIYALIDSGAVEIYCDAIAIGSIGQTNFLQQRSHKEVLPLGSYSFNVVRIAQKEYLHNCFKEVFGIEGVSHKQSMKLQHAIAGRLRAEPDKGGQQTLEQLRADLRSNAPVLRTAVSLALNRIYGIHVRPTEFSLNIIPLDEDDYHSESNIANLFGLNELQTHKAIESGLLAVGGLNLRIESMKNHNALTGLQAIELPVFDSKLSFLDQQLDPERQVKLFRRVLEITGFPELSNVQPNSINLKRVLEIRESDECRSFRTWLRNSEDLSAEEIESHFSNIRARLAPLVHGTTGKIIRWVASTGTGLIPAAGTAVGAALGLIDSFLLDKVIPKSGPVTFLGTMYPSIYQNKL